VGKDRPDTIHDSEFAREAADALRKVEPGTDGNPVDIDFKWWPDD
jgi:hypothetical protein